MIGAEVHRGTSNLLAFVSFYTPIPRREALPGVRVALTSCRPWRRVGTASRRSCSQSRHSCSQSEHEKREWEHEWRRVGTGERRVGRQAASGSVERRVAFYMGIRSVGTDRLWWARTGIRGIVAIRGVTFVSFYTPERPNCSVVTSFAKLVWRPKISQRQLQLRGRTLPIRLTPRPLVTPRLSSASIGML